MYNEDNDIINIQLLYNPHMPTEPELWDGSFHPISLHRSIEYLALDAKNIKDSLNFMAKYIFSKLSQTSFSLYLHNQWTDFHKLSYSGKP